MRITTVWLECRYLVSRCLENIDGDFQCCEGLTLTVDAPKHRGSTEAFLCLSGRLLPVPRSLSLVSGCACARVSFWRAICPFDAG